MLRKSKIIRWAKPILGLAGLSCCLGISTGISLAQQSVDVAIDAKKDNSLFEENNNSNGGGEWLFAGLTMNDDYRRALLSFDIARQIPAGATITAVTLELTVDKTIAGAIDFDVHQLTRNWGEGSSDAPDEEGKGIAPAAGDATWNFAQFNSESWTAAGGDFSGTISASTSVDDNGTYQWSSAQMIQDVQDWLDGAAEDFGWILLSTDVGPITAKRFRSRESGVIGERPVLRVTYTSENPPTIQPDGIIQEKKKAPRGNDIYNLGGQGQSIRLRGRSKARFAFSWLIQNDGNLKDDFQIRASKGNRFFGATYFRSSGGGRANVTGSLTRGGVTLEGSRPDATDQFQAKVKSTKKAAGRSKSLLFSFLAESKTQASKGDRVKAKVSKRR